MTEEFKIAWRNLWRNRRRTLLTAASVSFGVFFALIMRSIQLGSYDHMINNFIGSFTGYLQVQHVKYQDNPMVDNSFIYDDSLVDAISSLDNVVSVSPHLESFTLASGGTQTKGVAVIAIDPDREKYFSDPEAKLVKYRINDESVRKIQEGNLVPEKVLTRIRKNLDRSYSSLSRLELELGLDDEEKTLFLPEILKHVEFANGYLSGEDEGVLVSDRLSDFLRIGIGDSVILMGQGYHGVSAAGIFPVRGIIKIPAPDLDNRLIIMTIPAAQRFFDAEGRISSLVINLTDRSERTISSVRNRINTFLQDKNITTRTWYELNPVLYQQIKGDSQSSLLILGVLYFIIFFGIFGTVLMMVSERRKEFGVLVAIGMQKGKLRRVVAIEMMLLGIVGLLAGVLASLPPVIYFSHWPVILRGELGNMMETWGWDAVLATAGVGSYYYPQVVIVAIMILFSMVYPLRKIGKLKETEALGA
jgi:ABC-type lipoprotein release transport system permease subunit